MSRSWGQARCGSSVNNGNASRELLSPPPPIGGGDRPRVTLCLQSPWAQLPRAIIKPARKLPRRDQACCWTCSHHRGEMEFSRLMRPNVGRVCVKLGLSALGADPDKLIGSGSRSRTGTASGRDVLCDDPCSLCCTRQYMYEWDATPRTGQGKLRVIGDACAP